MKSVLKNPLRVGYHHLKVGSEYEWFVDDYGFYNIFLIKHNGEKIVPLSLPPHQFFYYFDAVAEERRIKLTRIVK